jgi:hypothetical protein
MNHRNYFTKTEAAAFLGVEKWVLDKLMYLDIGPRYARIGKKIRYSKSAVLTWGAENLSWPI